MKVKINYDLLDKTSEAKKGYSLKRCAKRTLGCFAISSTLSTTEALVAGRGPELILPIYPLHLLIHTGFTFAWTLGLAELTNALAEDKLKLLVKDLRNGRINVNYDALIDAYKYKTKYKIKKNKRLPGLEQRKYLKFPVRDEYFGDREIPVVQEHIVGSNEYFLSYGEPEERKKVYSFARNPAFK